MYMHAIIVKRNTYFHYGFIHSPMNACPHDGIQVVSYLSCAQDHVLPILWPAKSVHSTDYGCYGYSEIWLGDDCFAALMTSTR